MPHAKGKMKGESGAGYEKRSKKAHGGKPLPKPPRAQRRAMVAAMRAGY